MARLSNASGSTARSACSRSRIGSPTWRGWFLPILGNRTALLLPEGRAALSDCRTVTSPSPSAGPRDSPTLGAPPTNGSLQIGNHGRVDVGHRRARPKKAARSAADSCGAAIGQDALENRRRNPQPRAHRRKRCRAKRYLESLKLLAQKERGQAERLNRPADRQQRWNAVRFRH